MSADYHTTTGDRLADLWRDCRQEARALRRRPAFAGLTIAALALGIGVSGAMFSTIDQLLVQGPAAVDRWRDVKRIYLTIQADDRTEATTGTFGYVTYRLLREHLGVADVAAYAISPAGFTYGNGAAARQVTVGQATADLFPLLGTRPVLGRFFTAAEDRPGGAESVVVVGFDFWKRELAGRSDVIGSPLRLGNQSYSVIGVAPRGFGGPQLRPVEAWMPVSLLGGTVDAAWTTTWNAQWLQIVVRAHPDISDQRLDEAATVAFRGGYTGGQRSLQAARLSGRSLLRNESGAELTEVAVTRWLAGISLVLLLVAAGNTANLQLARAVERRPELAVRRALGIGRGRLVRLFVIEGALLAAIGAVGGVAVAGLLGGMVRRVLLPGASWAGPIIDGRLVVGSACAALAVGIAVGYSTAARFGAPESGDGLGTASRHVAEGIAGFRRLLISAQSALSAILLVAAGLFLRSLHHVRHLDLGLEPDRILVVEPYWEENAGIGGEERTRRRQVFEEALAHVRQLPGVERAALTVGLPFQSSFAVSLRVAGSVSAAEGSPPPQVSAVSADYFATVGTRVLRGRRFTPADREGSEPVALVSLTMAERFWPGADPLDRCLHVGDGATTCTRVVGVVADAHQFALKEEPLPHYYLPIGQERGFGGTSLLVRPQAGHPANPSEIRRSLAETDPTISYVGVASLEQTIAPQVRPWRLGASILTLMASLTLGIAAFGLYSLVAFLVSQRTRELGVRLALGATRSSLALSVLRESVLAAAIGAAAGATVAFAIAPHLGPLLFDTDPRDPVVFSTVTTTLIAAAVVAAVLPAIRAGRTSPVMALRVD